MPKKMRACWPGVSRFVFKASDDKANRSSLAGQRGVGLERGLEILDRIRDEFGVPVLAYQVVFAKGMDVDLPRNLATSRNR